MNHPAMTNCHINNHRPHHTYKIGDVAHPADINTLHSADAASSRAVSSLKVGDPAFVRRSDKVWRYATVSEVGSGTATTRPYIVFIVGEDGSTKKIAKHHWGDRVRPLLDGRGHRRGSMAHRVGKNVSSGSHLKQQKSLHASCETLQTTSASPSPFHSQSSEELEHAAIQASGSVEEHRPSKPAANRRTKLKRRSSLKEMTSGFARRLSGEHKREEGVRLHHSLQTTSASPLPFNSQSSEELEHAAIQASGSVGGDDEEHRPSKPAANRRTKLKRRSSLKEMTSGFARRLSGEHKQEAGMMPFNSQSSEELEGAASQVSNSIGGHDEEHKPSKPAANRRTMQRRPSLKEMASGFTRRLSGEHKPEARMRHQHSAPINRLGSDCTMSPDEMKIHEFKEIPSSPEEYDIPASSSKGNREKKEMDIHPSVKFDESTLQSNSARRLNRKQSSRQTTNRMTTSGIFKKLMIGVADDDAVPPPTMAKSKSFRRHRRKTVNDLCDDTEGDDDDAQYIARRLKLERVFTAAPPASAASAPRAATAAVDTTTTNTSSRHSKPRRSGRRRATVDTTARPSPSMMKGLRAGSNKSFGRSNSNDNSNPSASVVMKNAFTQLMEEKKGARALRARSLQDIDSE